MAELVRTRRAAGRVRRGAPVACRALLAALLVTSGCGDASELCEVAWIGDEAAIEEAFFGLSPAQHQALVHLTGTVDGRLTHCSGTRISAGLVLTARHCLPIVEATDLVVASRGRTVRIEAAIPHPSLDVMVLQPAREEPPAASLPALALFGGALGEAWVERYAVAAGHGRTEYRLAGELHFSVQRIASFEEERLRVEALGDFGVCAGDSGGPLLVRDDEGAIAVAGVLSTSSTNCRKTGHYVRIDALTGWLGELGVELARPEGRDARQATGCGALDATGYCDGDRALWCDAGAVAGGVVVEDCPAGCGWDTARGGVGCVQPDQDPCQGVGRGRCEGELLLRCEEGTLERKDCAACGAVCGVDPADGRRGCR